MYRIGFAEDIHKLVKNRDLILGGIKIPFEFGEFAHSDGDVVFHALSESLLGALSLGDLGTYFPPNDDKFLNINSEIILLECYKKIIDRDYVINNIDISIILEKPKIKKYIIKMRENIAKLLNIDINDISIKANSNEGLDSIGESKAVMAKSIVLLRRNK